MLNTRPGLRGTVAIVTRGDDSACAIDATTYYDDPLQYPRFRIILDLVKLMNIRCESVLDVGGGSGEFCSLLRKGLNVQRLSLVDNRAEAVLAAGRRGIAARKVDANNETFPFPNEDFDFIFCGEVLEHLYDVDNCLGQIARVSKKGATLIVTTPNLVSWFNRLVVLLGYQPYYTEVSRRYDLGKFMRHNPSTSGHLRLFTLTAARGLLAKYGFEVSRAVGVPEKDMPFPLKPFDRILSVRPSLAGDFVLVSRKT